MIDANAVADWGHAACGSFRGKGGGAGLARRGVSVQKFRFAPISVSRFGENMKTERRFNVNNEQYKTLWRAFALLLSLQWHEALTSAVRKKKNPASGDCLSLLESSLDTYGITYDNFNKRRGQYDHERNCRAAEPL